MPELGRKLCEGCGQEFGRPPSCRPSVWARRRFCSSVCGSKAKTQPLAVRFEAKVDRSPGLGPDGECHLWTASTNEHGYGKCSIHRRRWERAHRVAWFLATGEWPDPFVCHTCDTRACVRFEHLFLGTNAENLHDMKVKGRQSRGTGRYNAKLTPEIVRTLRGSEAAVPTSLLAVRYGVSEGTIRDARRGDTWAWLAAEAMR